VDAAALIQSTPRANLHSVAIGVGTFLIVRLLKRYAPRVSGALVALVLLTVVVAALDLPAEGVGVLGSIPSGPPALTLPAMLPADYIKLLPGAMAIVAVPLCEGLLLVRSYSQKYGYKANDDRMLCAYGAANAAAGLTGSLLTGNSPSRSAAVDASGQRSQLPSLVAAGTIAMVRQSSTDLLAYLPRAALPGIVANAVLSLIEVHELGELWRIRHSEFWISAVGLLGVLVVAPENVGLRVMTFNIRFDESADGLDAWPLRRDDVAGFLRFHRPDAVGLQEVLAHPLDELLERLPDFEAFGEGRDGGWSGEHGPVLYRPERHELERQRAFWLSDTPDRPGAAWGARLSRICTWGRFRERASGETFSVRNVHLDHQSLEAREKSAELMAMLIGELPADEPAVLLGDFNCGEDTQAYARLVEYKPPPTEPLVDTLYAAREPAYGPSGTFTGFGRGELAGQCIDHVFVRGPLSVERLAVLSDTRDGRKPSDHRPVFADLTLGVPCFVPARIELRSGWRFQPDPQGVARGLTERSVNDSTWPVLLTGEPWERQGHPEYDGVAWYRRLVTVPRAWRDESVHVT